MKSLREHSRNRGSLLVGYALAYPFFDSSNLVKILENLVEMTRTDMLKHNLH